MTIEEVESTITHYDTTILGRLNKLRELIDNLHGLALLIDDDIYQLNQLCELHNYPTMLPSNYAFGLCSKRFNPQPPPPETVTYHGTDIPLKRDSIAPDDIPSECPF